MFVCAIGIIFFTVKENYDANNVTQSVPVKKDVPKKIEKQKEVKKKIEKPEKKDEQKQVKNLKLKKKNHLVK